MSILGNIRNAIAEKLNPTEQLSLAKDEWEQQLTDAENEGDEEAFEEAAEELNSINRELLRWRR